MVDINAATILRLRMGPLGLFQVEHTPCDLEYFFHSAFCARNPLPCSVEHCKKAAEPIAAHTRGTQCEQ